MSKEEKKDAKAEVEEAINKVKETVDKEDADVSETDSVENEQDDSDKVAELTDDLKRLQAEFENYKKRAEKESVKLCDYAKADILKKFLPVLDSFELAFKNTKDHEEFVKGVELIFSQFHNFLKENGVRPIETKDRKADPYLDDVMLTEKSDKPSGTILEELQKGYKFNELILRHSKVKVSKE